MSSPAVRTQLKSKWAWQSTAWPRSEPLDKTTDQKGHMRENKPRKTGKNAEPARKELNWREAWLSGTYAAKSERQNPGRKLKWHSSFRRLNRRSVAGVSNVTQLKFLLPSSLMRPSSPLHQLWSVFVCVCMCGVALLQAFHHSSLTVCLHLPSFVPGCST